jgi:hypothetical protein
VDAFIKVVPMPKRNHPASKKNISAPNTIDENKVVQFIE